MILGCIISKCKICDGTEIWILKISNFFNDKEDLFLVSFISRGIISNINVLVVLTTSITPRNFCIASVSDYHLIMHSFIDNIIE